jgi:two-component response regulator (ARR-B family)
MIKPEYVLEYLLYVGLFGRVEIILFLIIRRGLILLQVIRLATHWIELWSLLLPEDQREPIVTGCNRLLTVAHDFYFQATGWLHISRLDG